MSRAYRYPYPAHYVTADIVVFTYRDEHLYVLLVQRGNEPYKGRWALPGGFLKPDEEIEACARRELAEETSLQHFHLEPFATVGTLGRDPRGRVITVAHLALVRWMPDVEAGTDAEDAGWFMVDHLPKLAFDHGELIRTARTRLEQMLRERDLLLLQFLPEEFTVDQMRAVHQAVLGTTEGRRQFYRTAGELRLGKPETPPRRGLGALTGRRKRNR